MRASPRPKREIRLASKRHETLLGERVHELERNKPATRIDAIGYALV